MHKRVRLPIDVENVGSVTECWTYNRLAIIKQSPYYVDWIASNYNLFVDISNYNFLFGEISCYSPARYQRILHCRPINLFHVQRNNIVQKMKDHLNGGAYIVASLKYNEIRQSVHEVLLFGFDDQEKAFMSVELKNGFFVESRISFSYVEEVVEKVKSFFESNEHAGLKLSLLYQHPISVIELNPEFEPYYCPFETYRKLILEVNSKDIIQKSVYNFEICDDRDYAYIITGVKCTLIFGQMLRELLEGKDLGPWFNGIVNAAKKISEHKKMILISMKYLVEKWSKASKATAYEDIKHYEQCVLHAEKWKNMCIKFMLTRDVNILKRICQEVTLVHEQEEKSLLDFLNNGFDWVILNKCYI